MVSVLARAVNGKDYTFLYNFLINWKIRRYVYSVRNFPSCYIIKIWNRFWEIKCMLFSLNFSWKGTLLPVFKRNNSCKHIILESMSEMCYWFISTWIDLIQYLSEWVIVVYRQLFSNFSAISWWEQVNVQWDDDEICFVIDQHYNS
jgi:hypothetical protein